jgi:hypothetical protein
LPLGFSQRSFFEVLPWSNPCCARASTLHEVFLFLSSFLRRI